MKKHRFTKFLLSILLLGGVFGLSSCQSAEHNATVPVNQCEVKVFKEEGKEDKKAIVTIGVYNNTIYNVKQIEVTYNIYDEAKKPLVTGGVETYDVFVRHGVAGYISYSVPVDKTTGAAYAEITAGRVTQYYSLWDTYVAPFIIMIVLGGLALIFAAVDIFRDTWNKESVKELLSEKLSLYLVIFGLTILICLIPLMFSSWVVSLILIGGFVAVALLTALMAGIKLALINKK